MNPQDVQYGKVHTIPPVHAHGSPWDSLPLTGFELWIVALIALGFVLVGLAFRESVR